MEVLMGVVITLLVEVGIWLAVRQWRQNLPGRPPQRPPTLGQADNMAAFERVQATTPRVVVPKLARRTPRGLHRRRVEEQRQRLEE